LKLNSLAKEQPVPGGLTGAYWFGTIVCALAPLAAWIVQQLSAGNTARDTRASAQGSIAIRPPIRLVLSILAI
jgi:hypothetical protein